MKRAAGGWWQVAGSRCLVAAVWLFAALSLQAEVSGTVINRTTNKPAPDTVVTLYQLGQNGMQPVKTERANAEGNFSIDYTPQGPHLLQAIYDGVVYNRAVPPGAPTTGLDVDVYDSTPESPDSQVTQHMILIEPMGGILHINESILFDNTGNRTVNNPKGSVQIWIPSDIQGEPRLMVTAPEGMPIQRDVATTSDPNVRAIDYPVKPGETRFDLTYVLRPAEPPVFAGKVLHGGAPIRLVTPDTVTLVGDNVTQIGQEPRTKAKVYEVSGSEFSVQVDGTGSLQMAGDAPAAPSGGSGVQQIRARVYERVYVIVALALLILAAGFIVLYRRPSAAAAQPAASNEPQTKGSRK